MDYVIHMPVFYLPSKVVQQRLGHETVEMTLNVYIHVMPEDNEEIIGSFLNNINF